MKLTLNIEVADADAEALLLRVLEQLGAARPVVATPAQDPSRLLSVDEAAAALSCKPRRIYELKAQGRLPFVQERAGHRLTFRQSDIDAYLTTHHQEAQQHVRA